MRLYNVQVEEGACPLLEALPQSDRVVSLTAEALAARRDGTFGKGAVIASALAADVRRTTRAKVPRGELPEGAVPASKHLGRLWAAEETARLCGPGGPEALRPAQELALSWCIVTPVTGAVVLETAKQYEDSGLEPVNPRGVPSVPEPSSALCLVFGLCVVLLAVRRVPRRA